MAKTTLADFSKGSKKKKKPGAMPFGGAIGAPKGNGDAEADAAAPPPFGGKKKKKKKKGKSVGVAANLLAGLPGSGS